MSTKMQQVEWRRRQVFELSSKGQSQTEIARMLQISESTISRDLDHLRQQSNHNIRRYIDERLPGEYEKCLLGLNAITREAWNTAQNTEDRREKIQALSLAKECYSMKLELLNNASVVDDAIRFVSSNKFKDSLTSGDNHEIEREKSKEPDHDEDEDQLEKEQEEQTGEIITANQVF
ncbi:MAG: helix-turn-helix domain-containing protein [Nitrososphaeraceae archaeon]